MRRFVINLAFFVALFAVICCNAAVLTVGNESLNSRDMPMRLQKCNAYATYNEATGFTLTFSGSSVVPEGINSGFSDLKIVLEKGAILDIVQNEYERNTGISSSKNLTITGLGTVNIVNCKLSTAIYGESSVKLVGTAVNITQECETASAIATYLSGPITIDASFVTAVGYGALIHGGNITMTGSMLNLLQKASDQNSSDAVVEARWGNNVLSIVGCVVTMIAEDEDSKGFVGAKKILVGDSCIVAVTKNQSFYAWEKVSFLDSRVLAISKESWGVGTDDRDPFVNSYTPARSINGVDTCVFFGNGKYVVSSGKEKNTVLSGKVEVEDGDVELCSPDAIGVECYDFNMKNGSLKMVNDVSFKNCYEEILAKAAVEAVVVSSGAFGDWMGLHTTMLASMLEELAATLVENPSGNAKMAISCDNYVQSGGTIRQGDAMIGCRITRLGSYAWGVYNERIDATTIPAIVGGVYDGTFETFGYEDDGSLGGVWRDHYDICPTNRIGQVLTHVDYSPYWVHRDTPSNTDLLPYSLQGWSGPLVMAKRTNDFVGTTSFSAEDEICVHLAVQNQGEDIVTPFVVSIYLDGVCIGHDECQGLRNGYYLGWPNCKIGFVEPGKHQLMMCIDDSNAIVETDESNNRYSVDFTVAPPARTDDPSSADPAIVCEIAAEYRTKADVGVIPVAVVNVKETVKIAVKGLPSGVKFTAKDIVDRNTKVVMVPANSICGAPMRSGVYAATVTVTPTDKKSKMAKLVKTLTFVVRNAGEHIVRVDCDAAQGSVKGMGVYAKGKKVTLKATAVKGYIFSGWYDGDALVSRLASYVFTMPDKDVNLTARYISVAEDKAAIRLSVGGQAFSGTGGETPLPRDVVVRVGMYEEWPVAASALSATTVRVSGLPSGLKFTAKDVKATVKSAAVPANTIYGTPKMASKVDKNGKVTPSKVKITVTTAGKSKQEYILNVTVRGIPAEGTFNGGGENGLVTLTVAKTGKISGKYLEAGETWTLSAAGFDTWDDDDRMTATLTAKCGKEVKTVWLIYENGYMAGFSVPVAEADDDTVLFEAMRNEWKNSSRKALATQLKGRKVQVGEVLLTVGSNGSVKAKGMFDGYSASCSTVLIPTEELGRYVVYLYFPPKAGKFDGFTDMVELDLSAVSISP